MSRRDPIGKINRRAILCGAGVLLVGCSRSDPDITVDLSKRGAPRAVPDGGTLRFAVGTMITPRETAKAYQRLAAHLESRTGHVVEVIQRTTYTETNSLVESGEADFAFVCTGAYLSLKPAPPEILVVPVVNGKLTYSSLVLVRRSDAARDVGDLLGSSFAFVDPLSLTGRIYPEWAGRQAAGQTGPPFSPTTYTHSHSSSIDLVTSGRVRAAGVDSLVFEHFQKTQPARVADLRVLRRSEEFGNPPIVAGFGMSAAMRHLLRDALTQIHLHSDGRDALMALGFDRFALPDMPSYSGVAEMQKTVVQSESEAGP